MRLILSLLALVALTGCIYKMPPDGHIATLPNINNPTNTHEKAPSLIPGQ